MRILGVIIFLFGLWAASWGIWASFNRRRPIDLLGNVMAPLGIGFLILGGILVFVPNFLGF
jgi:hypothetical protein